MKSSLIRTLSGCFALACLLAPNAPAANNIVVSGVQRHIGGTNSNVPGSGTADNFDPSNTSIGSYAVFDMTKNGNDFADLRVTYNGGVSGNKVMVNRTSNSQTLTDNGTISVLLDTTAVGYAGSFRFEWFQPGTFSAGNFVGGSLIPDPILYTTFDIDFRQLVGVKTSQIHHYGFTASTVLTADFSERPGYVLFEDNNADSIFTNPTTAAQFLTLAGAASHDLLMGKQTQSGASLFMFEFRDPSQIILEEFPPIIIIPEMGSVYMLGIAGLLALLVLKRRT